MKYLVKVPFVRIWANLFIFKGKETTKQYGSDLGLYTIFAIVLIAIWQLNFTELMPTMDAAVVSTFVICYIVVIPLISMTSRRFYTVGLPWGLSFLILVPLLGYFWTAIVSLSANSTEESQIKITKNRVKAPIIAASIASPPASFVSAIVLLVFLTILSSYIPYHIHRPAVLNQTSDVFKDENGIVYFVQNDFLFYYNNDDNKTPHLFNRKKDNGDWLNPRGLVRDNNYFYYFLDDGGNGGQTNYCLRIYDKQFELIETIIFPDDMYIFGKCTANGLLYYVLSEKNTLTEDSKDVIPGKRSLYSYDASTKETKLVFEDIKKNTSVEDNGVSLFYNNSYHLQVISEKTSLDNWWDKEKRVSHRYFGDLFDFYLYNGNINATIHGEDYSFEVDKRIDTLCSNAFLIDNKVVFGAYNYVENKKCGNYSGYYCICNQGEVFLYKLDLDTKELEIMGEYEKGTFLIDYDLDGAKYYFDGGLYINNEFYRECEKIEPGPIEIKRGESYFRSEERKLDYDVSYLNGEFYGI